MIQLFKIRNFSDYFSDTISFFKASGKHFFKNYFIINGGFMMLLVAMIYFVVKFYIDALTANVGVNMNAKVNSFETFFEQNIAIFIIFIVIFVVLITILSILNFAFPILYLDLFQKNNGNNFDTKQIIVALKNNVGRLLLFALGTIFVYLPFFAIIIGVCIMLCFIIIGFPLLMVILPALYSWISIAFYDYLTKKSSFFEAFSVGLQAVKTDFWAIIGGTFLMIIIVQVLQTVVTLIPYFIGIAYYFFSADHLATNQSKVLSFLSIIMTIVFVISTIAGYIANNLLVVAQGMMYYSSREKLENNTADDLINKIGTDFE